MNHVINSNTFVISLVLKVFTKPLIISWSTGVFDIFITPRTGCLSDNLFYFDGLSRKCISSVSSVWKEEGGVGQVRAGGARASMTGTAASSRLGLLRVCGSRRRTDRRLWPQLRMQEPAWTPCFVLLLLAAPASFTSTEGDLRPCQKVTVILFAFYANMSTGSLFLLS